MNRHLNHDLDDRNIDPHADEISERYAGTVVNDEAENAMRDAYDAEQTELASLRREYVKIFRDLTYDLSMTPPKAKQYFTSCVTKNVGSLEGLTELERAERYVKAAELVTIPCGRCARSGRFVTMVLNGKPTGPGGECYRCNGKGFQKLSDARRNAAYDRHMVNRVARAMMNEGRHRDEHNAPCDVSPCDECTQSCDDTCHHNA
jgi:hypothetical protein